MKIYHEDPDVAIIHGDALEALPELERASVDCIVTSPPYWKLRDYGEDGQLGQERSSEDYITNLIMIFDEARRVLAPHGTLWLNLGDTYVDKELMGLPWKVAFALKFEGWLLRSEIIWHKTNPVPESAKDRPTRAHEHLFLFSLSPKYYFDHEAVKEPAKWERWGKQTVPKYEGTSTSTGWMKEKSKEELTAKAAEGRNVRTVWTMKTDNYTGGHLAVFPEELPRKCILAGCPEGGLVLDPFGGAGTTAVVARKEKRNAVLIELSETNCAMARDRLNQLSLLS